MAPTHHICRFSLCFLRRDRDTVISTLQSQLADARHQISVDKRAYKPSSSLNTSGLSLQAQSQIERLQAAKAESEVDIVLPNRSLSRHLQAACTPAVCCPSGVGHYTIKRRFHAWHRCNAVLQGWMSHQAWCRPCLRQATPKLNRSCRAADKMLQISCKCPGCWSGC